MKKSKNAVDTKGTRDNTNHITKDMTISQILNICPEAVEIMVDFGLHCFSCSVASFESIESGMKGHGLSDSDVNDLLVQVNKLIDKKYPSKKTDLGDDNKALGKTSVIYQELVPQEDNGSIDNDDNKAVSEDNKFVLALVGLCGSGKSESTNIFVEKGFQPIRFGQITMDIIRERGLEINEQNERSVREELRKMHGPDAYAKLNISKIDEMLSKGNVIIDGLYSWDEYKVLKEKYGEKLKVLSLFTAPFIRYMRLQNRSERPLTLDEAKARDIAEIEKIGKAGPIAIADHTIINEYTINELRNNINYIIDRYCS